MRESITGLSDYISKLNSRKLILVIVILITISYINSLSVYFIWDDYSLVVSNADIRSFRLKNIFKPLYKDDSPHVAKTPVYYRPLQTLTYILDYRAWQLNPFGYHITNITLHIANAILLYSLLLLLFQDSLFAFLGSALFGTNPIFTSSVTYISGRADILSVFFVFLMVAAFIKSVKDNKLNILFYCLSLFCFFLLLLSKETGVTAVLFLIIIDKLIFKYSITKTKHLIYVPFVLTLLFWQYLKPSATPGFHVAPANLLGIPWGLLTALKGMIIYTALSIIPFHLRMGRSITVISKLQDAWVYISLIFLIIIINLYIKGLRKNKLSILGLSWFYVPLFALLFFNYFFSKIDNEILLPEHNLYFCYAGLIIFIFSIIASIEFKMNARRYLAVMFLFFLIFYVTLTISENFFWQDEIRFFETNIKYNKESAFNFMTYANLGFAYERAKKFKQAEENFKLAAQRSKENPYFYNLLASFYIRNGDFDKALKSLMFSQELDGSFSSTYLLLGISYEKKGDTIEARHNFEKALLLNPSDYMAKRYLGALKDK